MLRARQRIPSNLPDVSPGPLLLALVAGLFLPISDDARADDTGIPANHRELSAITELWEPVPRKVTPGIGSALVVVGAREGQMVERACRRAGSGNRRTRQSYEDVQLHIEWRSPAKVAGDSQNRGNSGIFLMERYEVQVLDSFENPTYPNGQAASVYKQHIPLVNASRGPGEWQTYDVVFMAPQFGRDGRVSRPATVTVFHNNVLVQNNVVLHGPTEYIGEPRYEAHGPAPIELQDHGSEVAYRNIWVRPL